MTLAQLLALLQAHPITDLSAWLDKFEIEHSEARGAVEAAKAILTPASGAIMEVGTAGLLEVFEAMKTGFGEVGDPPAGLTI